VENSCGIVLDESLHNPSFNRVQFDTFRTEAGLNRFVMTPSKWVEHTAAIGIVSKAGRYGGTYAHSDIAKYNMRTKQLFLILALLCTMVQGAWAQASWDEVYAMTNTTSANWTARAAIIATTPLPSPSSSAWARA